MTLIKELDDTEGARPLVRVLRSLADEVHAHNMASFGGRSRELALVATKVEEARLWAIAHGEATGSHVTLDRREVLAKDV